MTSLLRARVSVTEAKELARHGDIRMTMRYTHHRLHDQARALESLPAVDCTCKIFLYLYRVHLLVTFYSIKGGTQQCLPVVDEKEASHSLSCWW